MQRQAVCANGVIQFYRDRRRRKKEAPKTIWNLQGEGQATLIEKINDRYKENDAFKKELDNKFLKEEESSDFTVKKVRLVISVKKLIDNNPQSNTYSLADRIQNLSFKISFKDAGATFLKWNKFETEYGEIDLGDITYERNAEATIGAGNDETVGKGEIKGGVTRSEEVKLKKNYAKLNGIFHKDNLAVSLQGTREVDLDGNIIIEATIKFKEKKGYFVDFKNLKNNKGQYLPWDSVQKNFQVLKIPEYTYAKPLTIAFDYNYTYRHVTKNANTYDESDDRVTFIDGSGHDDAVTLLEDDEIMPEHYSIYVYNRASTNKAATNKDTIRYPPIYLMGLNCEIDYDDKPLWFKSNENAEEFFEWLRYWGNENRSSKGSLFMGCYLLYWNNQPLTFNIAHNFDVAEIRKQ